MTVPVALDTDPSLPWSNETRMSLAAGFGRLLLTTTVGGGCSGSTIVG